MKTNRNPFHVSRLLDYTAAPVKLRLLSSPHSTDEKTEAQRSDVLRVTMLVKWARMSKTSVLPDLVECCGLGLFVCLFG